MNIDTMIMGTKWATENHKRQKRDPLSREISRWVGWLVVAMAVMEQGQ